MTNELQFFLVCFVFFVVPCFVVSGLLWKVALELADSEKKRREICGDLLDVPESTTVRVLRRVDSFFGFNQFN